jgi:hypothetical protein
MLTTARAGEVPAPRPSVWQQDPAADPAAPAAPPPAGAPSSVAKPTAPPTTTVGKPAPGVTTTTAAAHPATGATTTKATTAAPPPAVGHAFENMQTGTCLQLNTSSGAIQLWSCNGKDAQKFDFPSDGTMRVLGRCVQIQGSGDGARLGTATCTGSSAQQWDYNASYDLVSLKIIKCADVPDGSSSDGVAAQVWECNGNGNQKWRY